jgi:GxxExxY protein
MFVLRIGDARDAIQATSAVTGYVKNVKLDCGYRLDLIVGRSVLLELKSLEQLAPIHEAQLLTYLKRTRLKGGLLINFNVPLLRNGIIRKVL